MKKNNSVNCNNCDKTSLAKNVNSNTLAKGVGSASASGSNKPWPLPTNSIPYNPIYTNFVSKMNKVIKNNNIIFTTYLDITPQIITTIFCPISKEYIPLSNVTFNKSESIVTFSLPNITPYNQEKITFVIKGQVNLGNNFYNTYDCRL